MSSVLDPDSPVDDKKLGAGGAGPKDPRASIMTDLDKIKRMQSSKTRQKHAKYLMRSPTQSPAERLKLREAELKELYPDLWESFERYDKDGSGEIDAQELCVYLEVELGSKVSEADINTFFSEIDEDENGSVSFLELGEWYHGVINKLELGVASQARSGITVGNLFDFTRFQMLDPRASAQPGKKPGLSSNAAEVYDELELLETRNRFIIHPHSALHIVWDLTISVVLVITVMTLPLTMAFEELNAAMFYFNLIVDAIFLLDVVKNFFTGYVDKDGVVRLSRRRIVMFYLSGWFLPDLVSSVPIDLFLKFLDGFESDPLARSAKGLKLVRLIRITKLVRLLRVGRAAKYASAWRRFLEDKLHWRVHDTTIRMGKLALLLVVLAHWIGCIQFMICRLMDFPPSSWVVQARIDIKPVQAQYAWSFYKALAQMIGVGYETPPITNLSCVDLNDDWCVVEMWVTLASMYLGSLFYAIMISNISSIIFSMNFASRLFQEKSQQLNEYMRSKRLPPQLRDKVRDYYSLRYSEGKIFNEEAIMKDLSPALRREIMIFTCRELFLKVPFFRDSGSGFISSLATSLTPMVAFRGDTIIEEGTTGDSMFFLYSGTVEIFVEEYVEEEGGMQSGPAARSASTTSTTSRMASGGPRVTTIAKVGEGCFFGEVALLLPVRRTASVRSTSIAILYVLDRENLMASLKDFPEIFERLREIATSRVKRVTRRLRDSGKALSPKQRLEQVSDRDVQDLQAAVLAKYTQLQTHRRAKNPMANLGNLLAAGVKI